MSGVLKVFGTMVVIATLGMPWEKASAQEPAKAATPAAGSVVDVLDTCSWGGDIRIRQEAFDEIPIIADPPGVTRGGRNSYFRFRTRVYGQVDPMENVTGYIRLCNEFREYVHPDSESYEFPDEGVVDQLYLQVRNLFDDQIDVTVGRQDLMYGTGKVLLEGTPLDGSRTIYNDAVKLTFKGIENTTVDFLGIYNEAENDLVIDSEDRNLTGINPVDEPYTESGAGVYLKNKSMASMPFELYYFYKNEEAYTASRGELKIPVPEVDIHTVGGRVMPKWNDQLDGSFEVAGQMGEQAEADLEGLMADGVLNWRLPVMPDRKPCLGLGFYYLSGDDPESADNEGWNPLWARWPQYSELYVYAWDADGAARWSNLSMPHVDFSMGLCPKTSGKLLVGYLSANENDGPGDGDERGWLGTLRIDTTLGEGVLAEKDKLSGHLLAEVLEPGDYYNVDETSYFLRWELAYSF